MTETITIVAEIQTRMNKLSRTQIQAAHDRLKLVDDGEAVIGTLHNEDLHRLWAVQDTYCSEGGMALISLKFGDLLKEGESAAAAEKLQRCKEAAELVRKMFWFQATEDIGTHAGNIGLRSGWIIVRCKDSEASSLIDILRSAL